MFTLKTGQRKNLFADHFEKLTFSSTVKVSHFNEREFQAISSDEDIQSSD